MYLTEQTRNLMVEVAQALHKSQKDPAFFGEAFIMSYPHYFVEGATQDWWRGWGDWFKGLGKEAEAGRNDIKRQFDDAMYAVNKMVEIIKKYPDIDKGMDVQMSDVLSHVKKILSDHQPEIEDLNKKLRGAAVSAKYGGAPGPYAPTIDIGAIYDQFKTYFNSLPMPVNYPYEISNWLVSTASSNRPFIKYLKSSLVTSKVDARMVSEGEDFYDDLLAVAPPRTAPDPVKKDIHDKLASIGVNDGKMFGQLYGLLMGILRSSPATTPAPSTTTTPVPSSTTTTPPAPTPTP